MKAPTHCQRCTETGELFRYPVGHSVAWVCRACFTEMTGRPMGPPRMDPRFRGEQKEMEL